MKKINAVELLLSDNRGVYIPRDFIQCFDLTKWNISLSEKDEKELSDPGNEFYWEVWGKILDNAYFEQDNHVWRLYQDGDLWALCYELMTDEEKENFGFEVEVKPC